MKCETCGMEIIELSNKDGVFCGLCMKDFCCDSRAILHFEADHPELWHEAIRQSIEEPIKDNVVPMRSKK